MRTFLRLLGDGLRLSLLRRPRHLPWDAGFGHWLALLLLTEAIDAGYEWALTDPPRMLDRYGVLTSMAAGFVTLLAAAALVALTRRPRLYWIAAAWLQGAFVLPNIVIGAAHWYAHGSGGATYYTLAWGVALAWTLLFVLRAAWTLARPARLRGLGAALLSFVLLLGPWFWLPQHTLWSTDWSAVADEASDEGPEPGLLAAPERTMYDQPRQLDAALDALAPQRPGTVDLYAVAFGGDATEDVFRNEVEYVERLFAERFDARGRTLALLNHPESAERRPLATATNLERALKGIAERMDPAEDVLFLYLTSHGSPEHELLVQQPPLPLDQLDPARLRAALDAAGIGWRVLVVSACYSGGYIEALRDPRTLVLTASSAKRPSFGCGAASEITWFGKAFLTLGLNRESDFVAAFEHARERVAAWEKRDDMKPSRPQIAQGEEIAAQLARWRAEFTPGPAVKFVPAKPVREEAASGPDEPPEAPAANDG